VNSKQVVAAISVAVLLLILVYPAFSTGTVSLQAHSTKVQKADHVYVTFANIWAHQKGQADSNAWKLISNQSQTVDLVSLENSTQFLAKGQVSVSSYDSIRLEVSNVTWVFNKTTTNLPAETSRLTTNLDFTVVAGKESSITIIISGHQEVVGGTKLFAATLSATITSNS
jgi:hypothetical protein